MDRKCSSSEKALYDGDASHALQRREAAWKRSDEERFALLMEHLGPCRRLLDVGCGWGQFLGLAGDRVEAAFGVDESRNRVEAMERAAPEARLVICRADRIGFQNAAFDTLVTSQMLHEVKLFGKPGDLSRVCSEIHRLLAPGGTYLFLDHRDAGPGEVEVAWPPGKTDRLAAFEERFTYTKVNHEILPNGNLRISRRGLQDFLTKDWALDSPMESIEMRETHNVFTQEETRALVEDAGLRLHRWIPFSDIRNDIAEAKGKLAVGEPWFRKFLLVAEKRGGTVSPEPPRR
ncbi:MAG: class I SAM-dependent methyltransferase [Planctomycetota bacterium]